MKNTGPQQFEDVTERAGISQLAAQYVELGHGRAGFRQRWTRRHLRRPRRPGSPGSAGALDFPQRRRHEVRRRVARRRPLFRNQERRPRRRLRRLRQRRQDRRLHGESGRAGLSAAQHFAGRRITGSRSNWSATNPTATASERRWKWSPAANASSTSAWPDRAISRPTIRGFISVWDPRRRSTG